MMLLNLLAGLVLAVNGQVHTCKGEILNYLNITGSDVTVMDCRIRESSPGVNAVTVYGNRNTLRRITVERAGAAGVYFWSGDGHVLEDSSIRDPARRQGRDSWGIANRAATNLTVRRVTVYGSGYTQWDAENLTPTTTGTAGTKLLDNEFIIPEEYRTDCKGNIQRDGPCQCGEFGIALKGGDNGLAEGNLISGYRKSDPICGGSGSPGSGISTAAGGTETWTRKWTFKGNTVTDSTFGLYIGVATSDVAVTANRFCNNTTGIQDGYSKTTSYTDNEFYNSPLNMYSPTPGPITGSRQLVDCH